MMTANHIRAIRKSMQMTQAALADMIGVSRQYVARLEVGLQEPSKPLSLLLEAFESGWRPAPPLTEGQKAVLRSQRAATAGAAAAKKRREREAAHGSIVSRADKAPQRRS